MEIIIRFQNVYDLIDIMEERGMAKVGRSPWSLTLSCQQIYTTLLEELIGHHFMYFHKAYEPNDICATHDDCIYSLLIYHRLYTKIIGKPPFDLMQWLDEYIEVGNEYGWRGNPFNIVTDKTISKNGITVKYFYCNTNAGGPIFKNPTPKEDTYDLTNEDDGIFINNTRLFKMNFQYKNMPHYDNLLKELEQSIQNNLKVYKQLKKIYKQ